MPELDFNTSDIEHVIQATKDYVDQRGFEHDTWNRADAHLHVVLIDHDTDTKRLLKVAWTPETVHALETDVEFATFIRNRTKDGQPIKTPSATFHAENGIGFAEYEWLDVDMWGEQYPEPTVMHLNKHHFERMFQVLLFFDQFKKNSLSMYFIGESGRYTENAANERFERHVNNAQNNELLSAKQCEGLRTFWEKYPFEQGFQHHDFVPWNMGRDTDGKFVLIDAEHARWGMRCYDIAYFYLQTTLSAQEPDLAKRFLRFMFDRFNEEKREFAIRKHVFKPLAYYVVVSINEHAVAGRKKPLADAKKLLKTIVAGDAEALL